jgi:hypothetical protein
LSGERHLLDFGRLRGRWGGLARHRLLLLGLCERNVG